MQFSTIEKIKKVNLSGRDILVSLLVILGKYFIEFLRFLMNYDNKFMPLNPQK